MKIIKLLIIFFIGTFLYVNIYANMGIGDILYTVPGKEIVIVGIDGSLHSFRADGTELTDFDWPLTPPPGEKFINSPGFFDIDNNFITKEILIFSKTTGGNYKLHCYDTLANELFKTGNTNTHTVIDTLPITIPDTVTSKPIILHLSEDKIPQLIYGADDGKIHIKTLNDPIVNYCDPINLDSNSLSVWLEEISFGDKKFILGSCSSGIVKLFQIKNNLEEKCSNATYSFPIIGKVNTQIIDSKLFIALTGKNKISILVCNLLSDNPSFEIKQTIDNVPFEIASSAVIFYNKSNRETSTYKIAISDKLNRIYTCSESDTAINSLNNISNQENFQNSVLLYSGLNFGNYKGLQALFPLSQRFYSPVNESSIFYGKYYHEPQPRVSEIMLYPSYISPNNDNKMDYGMASIFLSYSTPIEVKATIENNENNYLLELFDNYYIPMDSNLIPSLQVLFNGKDGEKVLDTGVYTLRIKVKGVTGYEVEKTAKFIIDLTPPHIKSLTLNSDYLPLITSNYDTVVFNLEANDDCKLNYTGRSMQNVVYSFIKTDDPSVFDTRRGKIFDNIPTEITWDGINSKTGTQMPDGDYYLEVKVYDAAMNETTANTIKDENNRFSSIITIDRTPSYIRNISVNPTIALNNETPTIQINLSEPAKITTCSLLDRNGNYVESKTGELIKNMEIDLTDRNTFTLLDNDNNPLNINWSNENERNMLPDGLYKIKVQTIDISEKYNDKNIGNTNSAEAIVIKNRIPAYIAYPERKNNSKIPKLNTGFAIVGSAVDPDLRNTNDFVDYKLWYTTGLLNSSEISSDFVNYNGSPSGNWLSIEVPELNRDPNTNDTTTSILQVTDGVLGFFTENIEDGETYTIVLAVRDAGTFSLDYTYFVVTNESQECGYFVNIDSPDENGFTISKDNLYETISFNIVPNTEPSDIVLFIKDSSDKIIKYDNIYGLIGAGDFKWYGLDNAGRYIKSDTYTFEIQAIGKETHRFAKNTVTCYVNNQIKEPLTIEEFYATNGGENKFYFTSDEIISIHYKLNNEANVKLYLNGSMVENYYKIEDTVFGNTFSNGIYNVRLDASYGTDNESISKELTFYVGNINSNPDTSNYGLYILNETDDSYVQGDANFNWSCNPKGIFYSPIKFNSSIVYKGYIREPRIFRFTSKLSNTTENDTITTINKSYTWTFKNWWPEHRDVSFNYYPPKNMYVTNVVITHADSNCNKEGGEHYGYVNYGYKVVFWGSIDTKGACCCGYSSGRLDAEINCKKINKNADYNNYALVYFDKRGDKIDNYSFFLKPCVDNKGYKIDETNAPLQYLSIYSENISPDYSSAPLQKGVYFALKGENKSIIINNTSINSLGIIFKLNHQDSNVFYYEDSKWINIKGENSTFTLNDLSSIGQLSDFDNPDTKGLYICKDDTGNIKIYCNTDNDNDYFQGVIYSNDVGVVLTKDDISVENMKKDEIYFDVKNYDNDSNNFIKIYSDIKNTNICSSTQKYLGKESKYYNENCLNNGKYHFIDYSILNFSFIDSGTSTIDETFQSASDQITINFGKNGPYFNILHLYKGNTKIDFTSTLTVSKTDAGINEVTEPETASFGIYYKDNKWHAVFRGGKITTTSLGITTDLPAGCHGTINGTNVIPDSSSDHLFNPELYPLISDGNPALFENGINIWRNGSNSTWLNIHSCSATGIITKPISSDYIQYIDTNLFA